MYLLSNVVIYMYRVATLSGILEKPGIWELLKKPGTTWNFEQNSLKKPGKPGILTIFTSSVVEFRFDSKIYHSNKKKLVIIFFIKNQI